MAHQPIDTNGANVSVMLCFIANQKLENEI
jgi:hypothetical protein